MARFEIKDIFHMSSLQQTIIVGKILDGVIETGMTILFSNRLKATILGVDFIDGKKEDEFVSEIGLRVKQFEPPSNIINSSVNVISQADASL